MHAGSLFKQLLGMVSNTDNDVPEDLKELLLPHLRHELYDHQLASLHFVRNVSTFLRMLRSVCWVAACLGCEAYGCEDSVDCCVRKQCVMLCARKGKAGSCCSCPVSSSRKM